jgi:hypothetical protein
MVLSANWRKTVLGGLLVGCAGVTLQCGGSPDSPFTPGAAAGTANGGAAGSSTASGGAAGSRSGSSGSGDESQSSAGEAGEVDSGGSSGSAAVVAGSGGKGSGTGGVGTAGTNGSAGTSSAGDAGHASSAGTGGTSAAGAAATGGSDATAGSAGAAGSGGAMSGGSSGAPAGGDTGSAGVSGSLGASGSAGASGSTGTSGAAGASGSAGNTAAGGSSASGGAGTSGGASGSANVGGSAGSGGACGSAIAFHPRAPVVYFLLDRSSSMFAPTDYWSPVKASVLATIDAFASQIRFGLAAYTGVASKTCPLDLTSAGGIALDNYATINQMLSPLASPGVKAESPTAAAIASVRATVTAQSGSSKTIFLVTDGGHDFCDDGDLRCPADALVAQLQTTFAAGVQTSVFGIKGATYLDLTDTQAEANAGSGAPVVGDALNLYYACSGGTDWRALWIAKGSVANQALGSYVSSTSTNTPYTLLDTTQPDTMTSALKTATAALRSCTYDLSGAQVNQSLAAQGVVRIDGTSIPMDASNGWRLNSATELELVGSACATWRTAASQNISFDFPCSILGP